MNTDAWPTVRHRLGALWVIAMCCAALYVNALGGAFVADDLPAIVESPKAVRWRDVLSLFTGSWAASYGAFTYYRPISSLSLLLDYQLWGLNPVGYHLTNIILHAANAWLICLILGALLGSQRTALFAALLFAAHPVQTEAVTFASSRTDCLFALFYLAAVWCFLRSRDADDTPRRRFLFWSLGFFMLALMSKEMAISLPVVVVALDLTRRPDRGLLAIPRSLARQSPFFVVAALFVLLRSHALGSMSLGGHGGGTWVERVVDMALTVATYLRLLCLPTNLYVDYHCVGPLTLLSLRGLAAVALCAAMVVLTLRSRSRSPLIFLAGCLFIFGLGPTFLPSVPLRRMVAERHLYVPAIAAFALAAWAFANYPRGRVTSAGFAVVCLSALTVAQNFAWQDERSLWYKKLSESRSLSEGHANLASIYDQRGWLGRAEGEFRKMVRANPENTKAAFYLAVVAIKRGKPDEAVAVLKGLLAREPSNHDARVLLGVAHIRGGRTEAAMAEFGAVLQAQPGNINARLNLAAIYRRMNQLERAEMELKRAVDANPKEPDVYVQLGGLYEQWGRFDNAEAMYSQALALNPRLMAARSGIVSVRTRLGAIRAVPNER